MVLDRRNGNHRRCAGPLGQRDFKTRGKLRSKRNSAKGGLKPLEGISRGNRGETGPLSKGELWQSPLRPAWTLGKTLNKRVGGGKGQAYRPYIESWKNVSREMGKPRNCEKKGKALEGTLLAQLLSKGANQGG